MIEDPSELFGQIFAMAGGDSIGDPTTFSNDLGTVTITMVTGSIFSVECSDVWISASSDTSIANEIIRAAEEAVKANDPLGLRKEKKQ